MTLNYEQAVKVWAAKKTGLAYDGIDRVEITFEEGHRWSTMTYDSAELSIDAVGATGKRYQIMAVSGYDAWNFADLLKEILEAGVVGYEPETLGNDDDDGTMPQNVEALREAVVGHRIVSAAQGEAKSEWGSYMERAFIITLDNGKRVILRDSSDCCAYTELQEFLLNVELIDHVILGVGTTEQYTTWHIFADLGDVMKMKVGWSCGNPFYYGYGFSLTVEDIPA